jgi:hypothetical protein
MHCGTLANLPIQPGELQLPIDDHSTRQCTADTQERTRQRYKTTTSSTGTESPPVEDNSKHVSNSPVLWMGCRPS